MRTEQELENRMSQPGGADTEFARHLDGDIVILGVGGKMGPTLAMLLRRALHEAGRSSHVYGVARFSEPGLADRLQRNGISPITCELLERDQLNELPEAPNVIYMAAKKFGTTGAEHQTWAMNTQLPALVAERYRTSRIVCFSSGNVYPLVPVTSGGATESTPPEPRGEYAQSVLGRERIFENAAHRWGTKSCLLRLNYAIDLRYGVLADIARAVYEERPVDVRMPLVNVIWQGDANSVAIRSLALCNAPPAILNLTGPETVSARWLAGRFGELFGKKVVFQGEEGDLALLNNAAKCHQLFGYPSVSLGELMEWTASWIAEGGVSSRKPTHFQTTDGKF